MRLYYYKARHGSNFGDDLNRWLWPRLLPGLWREDDGTVFSGVGTIITRAMPNADRWIVFGSGAGYGPPPSGFGGPAWHIIAVRGPLSARVLGLAPHLAVTDGAILLATLPELQPAAEGQRKGIVFVPHFQALETGLWREAAERAGVEFLDPGADSVRVIERIRTARLVLADAMHAAIVADSMRVPWIPLTTSDRISTFKWLDWTCSMGVPYEPVALPPTGLLDKIRNATLRLYGESHTVSERTLEAAMAHYHRQRRMKVRPWWPTFSKYARRAFDDAPRRLLSSRPFSRLAAPDDRQLDRAATLLRKLAAGGGYLSHSQQHERATDRMCVGLDTVRALAAQ
jgi:succinoglycan biosynthesis protein ExoV